MKLFKFFLPLALLIISAGAACAATSISPQDPQIFFENQVSEAPQYPGGDAALDNFIRTNLRFSADDIENRTRGRIVVNYVIRRDGSIDNVKVVKGINSALDSQVVKLIQKTKGWTAGSLNGHPVDVQRNFVLSVRCN